MSNLDQSSDALQTRDGRTVIINPNNTWQFKDAPKQPSEQSRKEIFMYVLMLALSLMFLSGGYYVEHKHHLTFLSHLLTEIGIAWLIAIILGITVEYASRKRDERRFRTEREAIKQDVFEHVLGHRLPEGTFAELDSQILRTPFIRRNFKCGYKLQAYAEGAEKFMKVEGTMTYEIENRTSETLPFLFTTMIENAPIARLNDLVNFIRVNVRGCEKPLTLDTPAKINQAVNTTKRPNHKVIEETISIPGNGFASATVIFESVKGFEGGVSFLLHKLQTVGFWLKVESPGDVSVSASSYFPEPLAEGSEHFPDNNVYNWELKHPILPYQGVYITWKSKTPPEPAPPPPKALPAETVKPG